jgi:hypothetical protein
MRRLSPVLLAVALAVVGAGTPAAADHPEVSQAFSADSGDNCRYGVTQGKLAFAAVHPPEIPSVAVEGTLTDRPTPADPSFCRDDYYFSFATFAAYSGNVLVDRELQRANNQTVSFSFRLAPAPDGRVSQIDRVTIQVCRESLVWVGPISPQYCGRAVTYYPTPRITS